jgi:hypothetical protein
MARGKRSVQGAAVFGRASGGLLLLFAFAIGVSSLSAKVAAQSEEPAQPVLEQNRGVLELRFTPTRFAQIAVWLESEDGAQFGTVRLTESVARRGIGNRPGASQMNSGFHWPYGRREGVLPVWASRRASAPGAQSWKRVIFQARVTEGLASRTSPDHSPDDYYCLSFDKSRSTKDALDAVTCATQFSSDKGRFITETDVANGYGEPYENNNGIGRFRPLSLESLYPPRVDVRRCANGETGCLDHPDVESFAAHAREVMPEIDAVTMATPVGGIMQQIIFEVPADWPAGAYRACVEANVEGDYNETWNAQTFPTPRSPDDGWDSWALGFGYPYRGQPSVVYCADIEIGIDAMMSFAVSEPAGTPGSWNMDDPTYGATLEGMDRMTDDPVASPGSGADRLLLMDGGDRLQIDVRPPRSCRGDEPPGAVADFEVQTHPNELHAHQFARMRFRAATDDHGVQRYDVRVSTDPIDDATFMQAMPAKQATVEAEELLLPTSAQAGEMVTADMGGLVMSTHYFVAVRAMDSCAGAGPIRVAEVTTTERIFATVTPCFVATAAYGSPLASEIGILRRFRDRYLLTNAIGRELVAAYYSVGPELAEVIAGDESLRSWARWAMTPVVALANALAPAE